MPTTPEEAYDAVTSRFETRWNADTVAVVTPAPPIRWEGREKGGIPSSYFTRFTMRWVLENQRTFRNGDDQRYVTAGVIIIQIFGPRNGDEKVLERLRGLATVARNIFRGKTFDGGVKFRNVRIVHMDPEDKFYRVDVAMEWEYDEIA